MRRAVVIHIMLLAFLVAGVSVQTAYGFYKWYDDKGQLHVTDYPPPAKYAPKPEPEPAEEPEPQVAPAPPPAPPVQQVAPPAPPAPAAVAPPPAPVVKQAPAVPPAAPAVKPPVSAPPAPPAPPAPATAPTPATAPVATMPPKTAPGPAVAVPGMPIPISPAPPKAAPAVPQEMMPAAGLVGALMGGFLLTMVGIIFGLYIFFSLSLFKIAKKLNVQAAWAAWVPILQVWPFLASAGKPIWWVLLLFIPLVNLIVGVYVWMCISENLGKGKMLGLLMLLPVVNLIVLGYLAFSKSE